MMWSYNYRNGNWVVYRGDDVFAVVTEADAVNLCNLLNRISEP